MSDTSVIREISLSEELRGSVRLIELGLGEIQNIGGANDFYHLPMQLLASGIERMMKCYICFGYLEKNGELPDFRYLRSRGGRTGHGLIELKQEILSNYFSQRVPALQDDYEFLSTSNDLEKLIDILSEFGKFARYHNLDVVTDAERPSRNVESEWQQFETDIALREPGLVDKLVEVETHREACDFIHRQIVILLERFVRALSRQFTIGELGQKALQHSSMVSEFLHLKDESLGSRDYRKDTTRFKAKERKPHKRNWFDRRKRKKNPNYLHKTISKSEYEGDWPFYHDEVIIECRDTHWCVVTIDNIDYALNGSAQSRFKLEHVHDAGMAILGKSVGPFIAMALDLAKND